LSSSPDKQKINSLRPLRLALSEFSLASFAPLRESSFFVNLRLTAFDTLADKFAHAGNKAANLPHHILRGRNVRQDDTSGASFLIGLDF